MVSPPVTAGQLRRELMVACPALRPLGPFLHVAAGSEYAADDAPLALEAEIAVFPPVSGG
jgi:molybdopterin converting factor small subunit